MTQSVTVKFEDADFDLLKKRSGRAPLASFVRALVLDALHTGREVEPDEARPTRGKPQRVEVDLTPAIDAVERSTAELQEDHDEMLALLHEIRLRLDQPPPPKRGWLRLGEPEKRDVRDDARDAVKRWRHGAGLNGGAR